MTQPPGQWPAQPYGPQQQGQYPGAPYGQPGYQGGYGTQGYGQPQPGYPPQQPYPPAGQQPWPPGPPVAGGQRRSGNPVVIMVVLLVVLLGGGAGVAFFLSKGGKDDKAGGQGGKTALPSGMTTGKATGGTHFTGDLRTLLLAAPSTSHQWSQPPGTDGNLSIDEASQEYQDSTYAKTRFQRYNYKRGAVRTWHDTDDTLVEIKLFQFASVKDASGFVEEDQNSTKASFGAGNTSSISGVPGGELYVDSKKDQYNYVQVVSISGRNDIALVVVISQLNTPQPQVGNQLTTKQYAKLP